MAVRSHQRIRRSPQMARDEIIDATEAALAEMPFSALTVDAVMKRTGMTRSSFYHYFKSVDDLALGFLDRLEKAIREPVDDWLHGRGTDDYLGDTHRHLTDMFVAMDVHRPAMIALGQASSISESVYDAWRERILDYFVDLTARFILQQMMLGRSKVTDPQRVARALILMNNALSSDNLLRAEPDDPNEMGRTCANIWNATIYGS
ncbi:TetR/AcrR family transcriptional regulator [Pyruvatibacter mobilis]|uniref:TetR family transcriptional regulator n=1 Tax=Pyruvatibacter mobilis TaxID=1712261 RepID=A0A845Q458_9HYPH|nr:TetR/AcrR family transcriptional regulator [Pyruvatibacter mobilis]NBG94144.1 TetR family transcriptional regulator [Pyruvatibacter mobilis]QJD76454.1 TetR/AcrR family transcriptional regulator [Pyruvatibacter mobilis]